MYALRKPPEMTARERNEKVAAILARRCDVCGRWT